MISLFYSLYSKIIKLIADNNNLVKYASSGAINVVFPWLAIYFAVDRISVYDFLILTSAYATVQLGAFADLGLSKFFQLKARAGNEAALFNWVLPRVSLMSFFMSLFLCGSFFQLVRLEEDHLVWFFNISGIIFSAALRNLVCLRLELMGSYMHSTILKLVFWGLFFLPIFLFPDYTMRDTFLISSILRIIATIFVLYSISSLIYERGVPNNHLTEVNKIDLPSLLIFGFACLLGNSLDRYWPSVISDPSTKISLILMMDIGLKTTFFAGAIGQAKLNEMFQKGVDEVISQKLISCIALVSGIFFIIISFAALSKTSSTQPDNILVFFLFFYICAFSANQILVPIRQRLVAVRTIANRSLVGVLLASIPICISIFFESVLFVVFGLIIKAMYELIIYSRPVND